LAECSAFQDNAINVLVSDSAIRTVVIASYLNRSDDLSFHKLQGGQFLPVGSAAAFGRGTANLARRLRDAGKRILIVQDVAKYDRDVYKSVIGDATHWRKEIGLLASADVAPKPDIADLRVMRRIIVDSVKDRRPCVSGPLRFVDRLLVVDEASHPISHLYHPFVPLIGQNY